MLDANESWTRKQAVRHVGEIEYVRGVQGIGGLTI